MSYRAPLGLAAPGKVAPRRMIDIPPSDREAAKDILRPGIRDFCERVLAGVQKGERNAMNLFARAMDIVGGDVEVNAELACQRVFGLPASEVGRLVQMHQASSSAIGLDEAEQDGVALCQWVAGQDEARRERMLAAIGGGNAMALAERNGDH